MKKALVSTTLWVRATLARIHKVVLGTDKDPLTLCLTFLQTVIRFSFIKVVFMMKSVAE
jgi:hypothetical protein